MRLAKWRYYARSVPTLVRGFTNWPVLLTAGAHAREPFTLHLRPSGLRFRARTRLDAWIIKETCLDREYEQASVPIQDGWTIVDVGAGLGDFAILAAAGRWRCRVYAFEPAPDAFALLRSNIELNGLTNVQAFPQAVAGSPGPVLLDPLDCEPARRRTHTANASKGAIVVTATTLADLFRDLAIETCDFLKIDCEGGEYDILLSAPSTTLAKLHHVCLEYHEGVSPFGRDDLRRFFQNHGFAVAVVPNPVHREIGLLHARNRAWGAPQASSDRPPA